MLRTVLCCIVIVACCSPPLASATLNHEDMRDTLDRFNRTEHTYIDLLCNPDEVGYWSFIEGLKDKDFEIEIASDIIDARPTEDDYAQTLAELTTLRQRGVAGRVGEQNLSITGAHVTTEADLGLSLADFAESMLEIIAPEKVKPILNVLSEGDDVLLETADQAKYYLAVFEDYTQSEYFFQAVADYAQDSVLAGVARHLLDANDEMLEARLDYLSSNLETMGSYTLSTVSKVLGWDTFASLAPFSDDLIINDFADICGLLGDAFSTASTRWMIGFEGTMMVGDILFGTTNTFERYQEMKVFADIAQALTAKTKTLPTDDSVPTGKAYSSMTTKVDLYHMLATVHARGEYTLYLLVTNESGVLSVISEFLDGFKDSSETTQGWYETRMGILTDLDEGLDVFSEEMLGPTEDTGFDGQIQALVNQYDTLADGTKSYSAGMSSGTVVPSSDLRGLLTCDIFDFDNDGDDELVAVRLDPGNGWSISKDVHVADVSLVIEVYESTDGSTQLADHIESTVSGLPIYDRNSAIHVFRGQVGDDQAVYLDYASDFNDQQTTTICLTYDGSLRVRGGVALFTHYNAVLCYDGQSKDILTSAPPVFDEGGGWDKLGEANWGDFGVPSDSQLKEVRAQYENALADIGLHESRPRSPFFVPSSGPSDWVCTLRPVDHFSETDVTEDGTSDAEPAVTELGGVISTLTDTDTLGLTIYEQTGLLNSYR